MYFVLHTGELQFLQMLTGYIREQAPKGIPLDQMPLLYSQKHLHSQYIFQDMFKQFGFSFCQLHPSEIKYGTKMASHWLQWGIEDRT